MSVQILPIETVISDPKIRGGRPVVAGTGLRISDIAASHIFQGLSAEELPIHFPSLTLADAYAALAYYWSHKAEIDAEIRANAEEAEHWRTVLAAQKAAV